MQVTQLRMTQQPDAAHRGASRRGSNRSTPERRGLLPRVRGSLALGLCLAAGALACATPDTGPTIDLKEGQRLAAEGRYDEALAEFERLKALDPERESIRLALASTHLNMAERSLREKDEATYLDHLAKSQNEALRAVELNPDSATGHNVLGIISAYRADLDAAHKSFELARQLDPINPVFYLNLAEVNVYRGKLSRARRYISQGREIGAPPALIEMTEVLAAWRMGDYVEARDIFEDVLELNPKVARNWNGGENIETFEDLTRHCCETTTCGPFMKPACEDMKLKIAERQLTEETILREMQLEAERARRIKEVYNRRRDLDIVVEDLDKDGDDQAN